MINPKFSRLNTSSWDRGQMQPRKGSTESFRCASDSLFWVITQVNFIIHL